MVLKIEICLDNAAFQEAPNGNEITHILRDFALLLDGVRIGRGFYHVLRDTNGNNTGSATIADDRA